MELMNAGARQFAALILGALRSAVDVASRDAQRSEDLMGKLAFAIGREELLTGFLALNASDQRAVMVALDLALGSIPLECGCGLPRL